MHSSVRSTFFRRFSLRALTARSALVLSIALTLMILAYYRLSWSSLHDFVVSIDFYETLFFDFTVYYYRMGSHIFSTQAPVPGFEYSPPIAICFALFSLLSPPAATFLWGIVLVSATATCGWYAWRICRTPLRVIIPLSVVLWLTSFPILHNFRWGQVSVFVPLTLLAALHYYENERRVLSAFLLASAICLKYFPALFVVYFLFNKDYRYVLTLIISTFTLLFVLPALVLGWESTVTFLRLSVTEIVSVQRAAGGVNSQFFPNVFIRWFGETLGGGYTVQIIVTALSYLICEAGLLLAFLVTRSRISSRGGWVFVILFLSIPFFVATSWPHYLAYLPFCHAFIFSRALETPLSSERRLGWIWLTLLLSIFCSSVFLFQLIGGWQPYNRLGFLWMSNALLAISASGLLFPQLKGQRKIPVSP